MFICIHVCVYIYIYIHIYIYIVTIAAARHGLPRRPRAEGGAAHQAAGCVSVALVLLLKYE